MRPGPATAASFLLCPGSCSEDGGKPPAESLSVPLTLQEVHRCEQREQVLEPRPAGPTLSTLTLTARSSVPNAVGIDMYSTPQTERDRMPLSVAVP